MNTFLSKSEIVELTGRKQRQKQIEQLAAMHIVFTIDAFGWPKVLRKTLEAELGAVNSSSTRRNTFLNDDELFLG